MGTVRTETSAWRRRIREERGMTQEQVARLCGVALRTYQNWEMPKRAGGSEPTAEHFIRWCKVMGVNPTDAPYTWEIPGKANASSFQPRALPEAA